MLTGEELYLMPMGQLVLLYLEYCGKFEPAVRSFEPLYADVCTSNCGREIHSKCFAI